MRRRLIKLLFLLMFLVIPRDHAYAQLVWNPTEFAPAINPPGGAGNYLPINNPTFTGTLTAPGSQFWNSSGLTASNITAGNITTNTINIQGTLRFNGSPMGGTCTGSDFVNAINQFGVPSCATPAGGGGGSLPTPVSVANGGLGQGAAPTVGEILIATSSTMYQPFIPSGDLTMSPTGVFTVTSVNGVAGPFAPLNTSAGITPPANPVTGQQWYDTTTGQILIWNGTTWVVSSGGGGVSVGPTPPSNPVDGQLWFDPTTLQTYIWYTDPTSSQWVAVVNIGGNTSSPSFTGTVTFPDGSTWGSSGVTVVAGSKITGPDGGTWTSTGITLPATSEFTGGSFDLTGGGGSWNSTGLTLPATSTATFNGPVTYTGTLTFPDGSYYDVNGHEVMKNLGVGVVAQSDGASAGDGLVYGNSITVAGGWYPETGPNDLNAYWDSDGINLMYAVDAQYIQACAALDVAPTSPNDVEMLVQTNPASDVLENPWGQYTIQNYGAPATPLSGNTQTWQAEGLEFINSVGIHGDTWGNAIPGCTFTGVQGASLSDCAVAARSSDLFDNVNYKMIMFNPGLGTNSQASYTLRNSANIGGLYLTGVGFTATVGAQPSQLILATDAPNGIVVGPSSKVATFNTPTNTINALDITGNINSSVNIMITNSDAAGTGAQAAFGANAGLVGNNLWVAQTGNSYNGGYMTSGSGYIYDDSALYLIAGPKSNPPQINFAMNNQVIGQFLDDTLTIGLRLKGFGRYDGNTRSSFNLGQGYLSSMGWSQLAISGAAYADGNGNMVSDGGGGAGSSYFEINNTGGGVWWAGSLGAGQYVPYNETMTWGSYGIRPTHIGNNQDYGIPTCQNCNGFANGSRDTDGYINVAAWPVYLNFAKAFVGSPVCTGSTLGTAGMVWFANQIPTQIQIYCTDPGGASCNMAGGWIAYHCFDISG